MKNKANAIKINEEAVLLGKADTPTSYRRHNISESYPM